MLATVAGAGCASVSDRPESSVIATTGIPVVTTAAPPTAQAEPLGATIQATIDSWAEGGQISGTAAYTVDNLRPITATNSYTEVTGTLYAVDVMVQAQTGVTTVHPWHFALRTANGTNLTPDLSAVDNGLPATDLPQGQKVSGPVAVDVPPGETIAEVVLTNGLGGTQLGRWIVG
ncbi:hypothetical protein C6A85_000000105710 [Mycobacterium sp. ITM-2017-0098]|nr:hypothetical protein C6A85_000000105710 [Mycobacterium sp. ITM-2017-0098]